MNRKRLLSWLFLVVNGCAWLVVILLAMANKESGAGGFVAIWYGVLLGAVVPLQLILAATWACTEKGGHLKRGTWLTVFVFLACFAASYFTYKPAKVLHEYLVFYITQVLAICYGFHIASKWGLLSGDTLEEKKKKRKFQISLKAMFGWPTIIVIFACGFSYTRNRSSNLHELHFLWIWVPLIAVLTVSTTVLLDRQAAWWRRWGSLPVAALVLSGLTVLFSSDLRYDNYFYLAGGCLAAQLYLALGHSVQRLGAVPPPECISMALKLRDKTFHVSQIGIEWMRVKPYRIFLVIVLALLLFSTVIISLVSRVYFNSPTEM